MTEHRSTGKSRASAFGSTPSLRRIDAEAASLQTDEILLQVEEFRYRFFLSFFREMGFTILASGSTSSWLIGPVRFDLEYVPNTCHTYDIYSPDLPNICICCLDVVFSFQREAAIFM